MCAAEAARAGAAALLVTSLPGGSFYQAGDALGAFDTYGLPDALPLLTLRKEDAAALIERAGNGGVRVRATLDVEQDADATGWNVVGTLPGRRPDRPIVVAGHHDAWFYGALDDATGVAASLAIARAMRECGYVPERPIVFGTHTAEEYGMAAAPFDYCVGAGWQIDRTHPEWQDGAALYLNLEGTGMPRPLLLECPPELDGFCRAVCEDAERDGLLAYGVVYDRPRPWTEAWPFLAAGVPSVNVNSHHAAFFRSEYHTQLDTPAFVDFGELTALTRVYARLIVAADRAGDAMLAPAARAADVRRRGRLDAAAAAGADVRGLGDVLDRFTVVDERPPAGAARAAFALLARELEAIDAHEAPAYRHEQALRDVEALDEALAALAAGDPAAAAAACERVGRNGLAAQLSPELLRLDAERHSPAHPRLGWAARGHLTSSPALPDEIRALRGDPEAPAPGEWLADALAAARAASAEDLQDRLRQMAETFENAVALMGRPTTTRS
jgi:hypothetical protein